MTYVFFDKIYTKNIFYLKIINYFYLFFRKINHIIKYVMLWTYFLYSLFRCNKKSFFLHSVSPHHLTRFFYQKVNFIKNTEKPIKLLLNNHSIILVNFNSNLMLSFLIIFLKVFSNKKNSFSIPNSLINSKITKLKNLFIKNNFDVFNRNLFLKKNFLIPKNFKSYKLHFIRYSRNFNISKILFYNLLKLAKLDSVKGVLLHENGFNDGLIYELFSDHNKQIVFSNSPLSLVLFKKTEKKNKKDFHLLFSTFFKKEINKISNKEFNMSKKDLNLRTKGIYKSAHMSYVKTFKKDERNKSYLSHLEINYNKPSIVFFLNCLTDAPNAGEFDKTNYYIDFYHFTLKLIEHCVNKKIDLYIKPHPQSYEYPSELIFMKNIMEVAEENKKKYFAKIEIINSKTTLDEIKNRFTNTIFLLIRGTVMSELLHLKMPTAYFANCLYSEYLSRLRLTNLDILDSRFISRYIKKFKKNCHKYSKFAIKTEAVLEKFKVNSIYKKIKRTSGIDNKKINNLFSKLNVINY
jgi:hypothetical protein